MKIKYLERYRLSVKTLSPLFIGSGKELTSKEYLYQANGHRAKIIPPRSLFFFLSRLGLVDTYVEAIRQNGMTLDGFLKQNHVSDAQREALEGYWIDAGDAVGDQHSIQGIQLFIKDAYGRPYLPGSSVKGALRTALLSLLIDQWPQKSEFSEDALNSLSKAKNRTDYRRQLQDRAEGLETDLFHRLGLTSEDRQPNALNDFMRAVSVSDSGSMDCKNLVLCRKIDLGIDGVPQKLNIDRECVAPQVRFESTLTLDTRYLQKIGMNVDTLRSALPHFADIYAKCFSDAFKLPEGSDKTPFQKLPLYLGGGVGFASKTEMYPLFGKAEGTKVTSELLNIQFPNYKRSNPHHERDVTLGVSPHMLKCTQYRGRLYPMGRCEVEIA